MPKAKQKTKHCLPQPDASSSSSSAAAVTNVPSTSATAARPATSATTTTTTTTAAADAHPSATSATTTAAAAAAAAHPSATSAATASSSSSSGSIVPHVRRENPSKRWCFTLNNPTPEELIMMMMMEPQGPATGWIEHLISIYTIPGIGEEEQYASSEDEWDVWDFDIPECEQRRQQQQQQPQQRQQPPVMAVVIGVSLGVSSEPWSHSILTSDDPPVGVVYLYDGKHSIAAILTVAAWEHLHHHQDLECFADLLNATVCLQQYRLLFHMAPEDSGCRFFLCVEQLTTVLPPAAPAAAPAAAAAPIFYDPNIPPCCCHTLDVPSLDEWLDDTQVSPTRNHQQQQQQQQHHHHHQHYYHQHHHHHHHH